MPVYYLDKNYNVITEDTDPEDKIDGKAIIIYQHILKWVYQPHKQSSNWIKSIAEGINTINSIINKPKNKKCINKVNLRHDYEKGITKAKKDTGISIDDRYENANEYVWNNFNTILEDGASIGIANMEGIRKFLLKHSNGPDSDRFIEDELN